MDDTSSNSNSTNTSDNNTNSIPIIVVTTTNDSYEQVLVQIIGNNTVIYDSRDATH